MLVASFWEETATPLPDKKLVSMKTGKPAFQLRQHLKEVYKDFCNRSCSKIAFSTFAKCRPPNIKLMAQAKLGQCLCEYCTNVQLKLNTCNILATVLENRYFNIFTFEFISFRLSIFFLSIYCIYFNAYYILHCCGWICDESWPLNNIHDVCYSGKIL